MIKDCFDLSSKLTFSSVINTNITIPAQTNKLDVYDGDSLFLHLRYFPKTRCSVKIWVLKLRKKYPESCAYGYTYLPFGDATVMSQKRARELALKYYEYVSKNGRKPDGVNFVYTRHFDSGRTLRNLYNYNFSMCEEEPQIVSDEQIEKLSVRPENSATNYLKFRLDGLLFLRVNYNRYSLKKYFMFVFKNRSVPLGVFPKINLAFARRVHNNVLSKLALVPQSKITSSLIKKLIVNEYKNDGVKYPVNLLRQKSSGKKKAHVKARLDPEKLLVKIAPEMKKLTSSVSTISFENAFEMWFVNWSRTVKKDTAEGCRSCVQRFLGEFFKYDLKELLDTRIVKHYLMSFADQSLHRTVYLYRVLNKVVNDAVFNEYIDSNPLPKLTKNITLLQAENHTVRHRKTLNHYSLKEDIRNVFSNYVYFMDDTYRAVIEALFYTLLRVNELLKIRKSQLVMKGSVWRLSTEDTKTLEEFSIPLVGYGRDLIEYQLRTTGDSPWLFPSRINPDRHLSYFTLYGIKSSLEINSIDLHGIRSVGASFFAQNEDVIPYNVGMAVLQHRYASNAHLCYDRTFLYKPRIKAMSIWGDFLREAIGKKTVC
ncbi:MAG: tyrosine-type recombinase/integrase [Succinivibrio sp.]|nr:tyrosine-type recombinase/integrase [Succinivibrio sp.]